MIDTYKTKLAISLKKTKSLLETIQKMLDEDRYCLDIAQQINAATGLLKSANISVLEHHLNTCGAHKLTSENQIERQTFIKELLQVFSVSNRK